MNKLLLFSFLAFFLNTIDKNESYITKEVSNLKELIKNGKFEEGFILLNGDTIKTEILRFSRRKNKNAFLFCITKSKTDSIKVYTARQISGYTIGKESFNRHISGDSQYFIHLNKTGKVILFERDGIPSDTRFLYYIKLPKYQNCFVICPNEQNISVTTIVGHTNGNSTTPSLDIYNSKNINKRFEIFVSTYLGDCIALKNMVQSEFYSINDIPTIIDKYNNCDDE